MVKFYHFALRIVRGNEILISIRSHSSVTNVQKIICNNPNYDRVNMNVYIKLLRFQPYVLKILIGNENLTLIKCLNSFTNLWKMICNNPNVELVNFNEQTKFGQILSIISHDIERKRNSEQNSDISEGPKLCYKHVKKWCVIISI